MDVGSNPFEGNKASLNINNEVATVSSIGSIDTAEDVASIFEESMGTYEGEPLSCDTLEENDIKIIKKELERYIEKLKEDLENSKNTKGFLTSIGNGIAEIFGKGDKGKESLIQSYEDLLKSLEENPEKILEVYQTITGGELNSQVLNNLKESEAVAFSLDSDTENAIIEEIENQLTTIEEDFEKTKESNGWISRTWDKIKNSTGIGASSNKTQAEIDTMKEELEALKKGETDIATAYKNITGKDLNQTELESFANGETNLAEASKAGQSVEKYKEGQKIVVDTVADIVSGIIAVGAVSLAPVTGGASLLFAGGVGAGLKVAIKASDCIGNDKKYKFTDGIYDVATGFVNGLMGPLTNGLGGAAGTGIAKVFGLRAVESTAKEGLEQAVKYAGKEIVGGAIEETIEQTAKQTGKGLLTRILAKQGSEYLLQEGAEATIKTTIGRVTAYGVDMVVDGSLSGAADGAIRAVAEGRYEDIVSDTFGGLVGRAVFSPVIGGGMRLATKAGGTILNKINNKITLKTMLPDGSATKFSQGEAGDCAFLSIFDGILNNEEMSKKLQKSILTDANGDITVSIGGKAVTVARDSLTDEMLSDKSGVRLFEQAYKQLMGADSLDGGFADVVAEQFGLTPVHIESDLITDEILEKISKEKGKTVLSLGLKLNEEGVVDAKGINQHYFSIKNIDTKNRTIDLVDTYDTSKTIRMSFDDVKTQGVSIDGGTIGDVGLPRGIRNAEDIKFRGIEDIDAEDIEMDDFSFLEERLTSLDGNEHIQKLLQEDIITEEELFMIATLDEFKFQQINELLEDSDIQKILKKGVIDKHSIFNISQLDENQFKQFILLLDDSNFKELMLKGLLDAEDLVEFSKLDQAQITKLFSLFEHNSFQSLMQKGLIDKNYLMYISNLSEAQISQFLLLFENSSFQYLMQKGVINSYSLMDITNLSEAQISQLLSLCENSSFQSLMQKGIINSYSLMDITNLSEVQISQLLSLCENSSFQSLVQKGLIDKNSLADFAKLNEVQILQLLSLCENNSFQKLMLNGLIGEEDLIAFSQLNQGQIVKLLSLYENSTLQELMQKGVISSYSLMDITTLSEVQISQLISLYENSTIQEFIQKGLMDTYSLMDIMNLSEVQIAQLLSLYENSTVQELMQKGLINKYELTNFAQLNEVQVSQLLSLYENSTIQELMQKGLINSYFLIDITNLSEAQIAQLLSLCENSSFQSLIKKGLINKYELTNFAKLNEIQVSQLLSLYENSTIQEFIQKGLIDSYALVNFAQLNEAQITKIILLFEDSNFQSLIQKGLIDKTILRDIARLNEAQITKIILLFEDSNFQSLIQKGLIDKTILKDIAQLNEAQITKIISLFEDSSFQSLIQKGVINSYPLMDITNLSEIQISQWLSLYENSTIQEFIQKGLIEESILIDISQLNQFKVAKWISLNENSIIQELMQKGLLSSYSVKDFINLNESEIQKILSLYENSTIQELIKKGLLSSYSVKDFINLNESEIQKLLSLYENSTIQGLIKKGLINKKNMFAYAKLNETQFAELLLLYENSSIQELIQKGVINSYSLMNFTNLSEAQIAQLLSLCQDSNIQELMQKRMITANNLFDFSQLGEDQYAKLKFVLKNNIPDLSRDDIDALLVLYSLLDEELTGIESLKFEQKIYVNDLIKKIKEKSNINELFNSEYMDRLNELSDKLTKNLKQTIVPTEITTKDMNKMMRGFFANNNSSLDNLLSTANFGQYGKEGLPLTYTRASFIKDLSESLKEVSEEKQNDIIRKLGISLINDADGKVIGYNGIIDLSKLAEEGIEGEILETATRFIKRNSIITGNKELDVALNSLIEGMPEFINVIGKQQHATQSLSVDVHILKVLQEAMSNEKYQNLSDLDKTCLKFATILHDIAKTEGVVDKSHPELSALYTRNVMEKYTFSKDINDRIFELVKNHHWLEDYNNGTESSDYIASLFRHKDDYTIAQIMAEADLKGVSDNFYELYSDALSIERQMPIVQSLEKINSSGQLVFTSKIIKEDLIPRVEYKGKTYKVLDFTQMSKDTDLSKYGFAPEVTYDNARFYIHMANSSENLETVEYLSDIANGGFLCASYVSLDNYNTYGDRPFGVSLDAENVNIANATSGNQSSGVEKDFDIFSEIITNNNKKLSQYRTTIPSKIKQQLNLSDEEYSELYQMLASKKYLSQILDDKYYTIGDKTLKGYEIKEAITAAGNELFDDLYHNESNLYNPKINAFVAKVKSIEEIPEEFLEFVQAHNLPIYIFGESKNFKNIL